MFHVEHFLNPFAHAASCLFAEKVVDGLLGFAHV